MAGSIEGIKRALEAVADQQFGEFYRNDTIRVPVTGAIILGVLDAFEEQVAKLETERNEAVALLRRIRQSAKSVRGHELFEFLKRVDKHEGNAKP